MTAPDAFWFSWSDAESGELLGESDQLVVAQELAGLLAEDGLAGEEREVELYEEPEHRLLARYDDSGVEEVAKPTTPASESAVAALGDRAQERWQVKGRGPAARRS